MQRTRTSLIFLDGGTTPFRVRFRRLTRAQPTNPDFNVLSCFAVTDKSRYPVWSIHGQAFPPPLPQTPRCCEAQVIPALSPHVGSEAEYMRAGLLFVRALPAARVRGGAAASAWNREPTLTQTFAPNFAKVRPVSTSIAPTNVRALLFQCQMLSLRAW